MQSVDYYYGVKILEKILGHSDNLSRTIQNPDLTTADAKYLIKCTMNTLQLKRSDNHFQLLCITVKDEVQNLGLMVPAQPRRRKISRKVLQGNSNSCYNKECDIEIYYRIISFNALDTVINAIIELFHQPGYANFENT